VRNQVSGLISCTALPEIPVAENAVNQDLDQEGGSCSGNLVEFTSPDILGRNRNSKIKATKIAAMTAL